jgi:glycosyltransferase involved in cell wall biosynthesis
MQNRAAPSDTSFQIEELRGASPSMRIAVVTETYPPEINGVAVTLAKVVEGLRQRNHSLQLIRPVQPFFDKQRSADADEILTAGLPIPRYPGLRMGMPSKKLLVRHWSTQRPDIVHIATEGPLGWSALHAARALKLPVSTDFRTNFHAYSIHYGAGWLHRAILRYLRKFHNSASCTTVPTQALASELQSWGFERLTVVARGVDTERFSPEHRSAYLRATWGAEPGDPVALYVGRLASEKNLGLLVRAYLVMRQTEPRMRLVVVGDGPERASLAAACPQAHFAGMQSGAELARHYASADLFVFPSLSETFGNVTIEAMASGLPVLAYDHAAASELLRGGQGGVAIAVGQEEQFMAQAGALCSDPGQRLLLSQQARQIALGRSWESIVIRFEALLRATIAAHPHGGIKTPHQPGASASAATAMR